MSLAIVTFGMKDGRTLKCEYGFKYHPATYWDPADTDVGDPTYFIDDEEITFDKLPKGLDVVANKMYEDSENRMFAYVTQNPSEFDDYYD